MAFLSFASRRVRLSSGRSEDVEYRPLAGNRGRKGHGVYLGAARATV